MQGFYVSAKGVVLIISSANGVQKSLDLNLKDAGQHQLIYVFVRQLYEPPPAMIGFTVKRRMQNSFWVFDIMLTIPDSR